MILNKIILHIFLLLLCTASYGQELYQHQLDEDKWDDLRDGIRYEGQPDGPGREWTYESPEEYRKAQKNWGSGGNGSGGGDGEGGRGQGSGGSQNGGSREYQESYDPPPSVAPSVVHGLGGLGWVLLIIFILALAFLIYYMFVNRERDGEKVSAIVELEDVNPSEIPLSELQRLLQEALAKSDFRGAVRIYFIFIIRDLAEKRWITWEKDKTNFQYLREMNDKNEYEDFNRSVSYFEIIWYGKRELDAGKFEQVRPNFTRLLDKLGVK